MEIEDFMKVRHVAASILGSIIRTRGPNIELCTNFALLAASQFVEKTKSLDDETSAIALDAFKVMVELPSSYFQGQTEEFLATRCALKAAALAKSLNNKLSTLIDVGLRT